MTIAAADIEYESVFVDLATLAFSTKLVSCRQYWPGAANTGGKGGLFKAIVGITLAVDNVKVFAGSGCRWVRQDCETITAEHAGCIVGGGTTATSYYIFQNPQTQFAAMPLLSDKFSTLQAAQLWYPGARINNPAKVERGETSVTAFGTALNNAALQHALTLYPVLAKEGVYRFNRPIEMFSKMRLTGEGGVSTRTVFVFESGNALIARRSSALAITNPQDENFKNAVEIHRIRFMGTEVAVPNNSDAQTSVADKTSYDIKRAGFYIGYRDPTPGSPEAQDAFPLMYNSVFSDLSFDRFRGSGFTILNGFSNVIRAVNNTNNKGFGIHTFDGNSTVVENVYTGRYNSSGGLWAESGGTLENCNGYDHTDTIRPGIVAGRPGSITRCYFTVRGGNVEGVARCIDHYGDGGMLKIEDTAVQYYSVDPNFPPIRIHGSGNDIIITPSSIGPIGASPNTTSLTDLIWSRGVGNKFYVSKQLSLFGAPLTYLEVDANGASIFGLGAVDHKPLRPNGFNAYISGTPGTSYGDHVIDTLKSRFPQVVLGNNAGNATIGTINTAAPLPTVAANPGVYINLNAAATKANGLFLKFGTGASGWSAISVH